MIAGIAAVIVAAVIILGGATGGLFDDTCSSISAETGTDCY